MSDAVPDADALEQRQAVGGDEEVTPHLGAEVPEADAVEQASPLRASQGRPKVRDDVPEADAIEQAQGVLDDDDEQDR